MPLLKQAIEQNSEKFSEWLHSLSEVELDQLSNEMNISGIGILFEWEDEVFDEIHSWYKSLCV